MMRRFYVSPVTEIRKFAFYRNTDIVAAIFPNALTIEKCAFDGCTKLQAIYIPNVTRIGFNAFRGCNKLRYQGYPNHVFLDRTDNIPFPLNINLPYINPFLDGLYLPNVTHIDFNAFEGCTSLTAITLPKVQDLGPKVFTSCRNLTVLNLPAATSVNLDSLEYPSLKELILTSPQNVSFVTQSSQLTEQISLTLHRNRTLDQTFHGDDWQGYHWKEIRLIGQIDEELRIEHERIERERIERERIKRERIERARPEERILYEMADLYEMAAKYEVGKYPN